MKNILARGGIEFLAVLFGITISLWVEDSRQNSDMQKKIIYDYKNIQEEIALDIENIDRISDLVKKQINILEELIDYNRGDREFNGDSIIARINKVTSPTFFGTQTAYNASVSSGRLNFSSDLKIKEYLFLGSTGILRECTLSKLEALVPVAFTKFPIFIFDPSLR